MPCMTSSEDSFRWGIYIHTGLGSQSLGQRPTSSTSGEGFPRVACVHLFPGYVVLEKVEENSLGSLLIETLISIF